jgi:hypothetical protein
MLKDIREFTPLTKYLGSTLTYFALPTPPLGSQRCEYSAGHLRILLDSYSIA